MLTDAILNRYGAVAATIGFTAAAALHELLGLDLWLLAAGSAVASLWLVAAEYLRMRKKAARWRRL